MLALLGLALFCLLVSAFLIGLQSTLESRPTPIPTARPSSTPYPPPPFPDAQATPIPSWPLFDVTPAPTPVANERAVARLVRPGSAPDLTGITSIQAIVRQRDILWVATDAGLLRWNPSTLVYDRITATDGLGSDRVNDVTVGHEGVVWAATTGGLSRYTPGRGAALDWTTYTMENTDGGLIDDRVAAIALDAGGRLWAGTARGLCRFTPDGEGDALAGTWRTVAADGLPDAPVRALEVDAQDAVWVATEAGLFRADDDTLEAESAQGLLIDASVAALGQDSTGRLWVATGDGRLIRFEPVQQAWATIPHSPGRPAGEVSVLAAGNVPERMWVAGDGGLGRYHQTAKSAALLSRPRGERWTIFVSARTPWQSTGVTIPRGRAVTIRYLEGTWGIWGGSEGVKTQAGAEGFAGEYRDDSPVPDAPVGALLGRIGEGQPFYVGNHRTFAAAEDGVLWLGNGDKWPGDNTGALVVEVIVHTPAEEPPSDTTPTPAPAQTATLGWQTLALPEPVAAVDVTALALDQSDVLWVGTTDGLFRYWEVWEHQPAGEPGSQPQRRIVFDDVGNLWTPDGARLYDGEQWTSFRDIEDNPAGSGYDRAVAVVGDGAGGVWVAHQSGTISHFDGRQWRHFTHGSQELWGQRHFIALASDRAGGVWVGFTGLAHVTWRDEARSRVKWQIVSNKYPVINSGFEWGRISGLVVDNLDGVWVSTHDWGLLRYADESWTAYADIFAPLRNGRPARVTPPVLDARGRLWTASASEGVARFDGRTWHMITPLADLSEYRVLRFAPDMIGGVWALHSHSHISYSDDRSWWVYGQADGLPEEIRSIAVNPVSNRLWVSSEAGLVRFDGARWEQLMLE
jgi:ligand-binding sensor domain-containing protein